MNTKVKKLVLSSSLLALTILLPSVFHMTGLDGRVFSPMHLPVLLTGFIVGPVWALMVGVLAPALSFVLNNGMPPVPTLFVMMFELGMYGLFSGLFYNYLRLTILPSLLSAMIIGRLAGGGFSFLLSKLFGFDIGFTAFLKASVIIALPAIILQVVLVPIMVKIYFKSKNVTARYL